MMPAKVVLEGCLGDWSKKSYIEPLSEKACNGMIELFAVDIRNIRQEEKKTEFYKSPVNFMNKKSMRSEYDAIDNADFVFIVAPHNFHCEIANHWLKGGKLKRNGKIFIEKPLDSSVERIRDLADLYGKEVEHRIIVVDHYIPKVNPLLAEIEKTREKLGKVKEMAYCILESEPILESREETLNEGLILDIYPHIMAISLKIAKALSQFQLCASKFKINDVKTGKYRSAHIEGETYAKIDAKISDVVVKSRIGKAVGRKDEKKMKINFERGEVTADFNLSTFSIRRDDHTETEGDLQKEHISSLLEDVIEKGRYNEAQFLTFYEGCEIAKIIKTLRERAGEPLLYEKFTPSNEIA